MNVKKTTAITVDITGALLPHRGVSRPELIELAPVLTTTLRELLDSPADTSDVSQWELNSPCRWAAEYKRDRKRSSLGQILAAADQLRNEVDRVVVVGGGGAFHSALAMMKACCDPFFNELSRGERGGRPRMYFCETNYDNDALRGVMHLLGENRSAPPPDQQCHQHWAMLATPAQSQSSGPNSWRRFAAPLLDLLSASCQYDAETINCRLIVFDAQEKPSRPAFNSADLFACAVLGLDVVKWLDGASDITQRSQSLPFDANPVLQTAAVHHLLIRDRSPDITLATWATALANLPKWRQSWAGSTRRVNGVSLTELMSQAAVAQGATSVTHHLLPTEYRTDLLYVDPPNDEKPLWRSAKESFPEIVDREFRRWLQKSRTANSPTVVTRLGRLDEWSLGQWMQLMILSEAVERKLASSV